MESREQETPNTELAQHVADAKKAVNSIVNYALQNGADKDAFSHLDSVYNPQFFNMLPKEMLPNHLAFTEAPVGLVYIREDNPAIFHTVVHESIHRAAHLRNGVGRYVNPKGFVAGLYGFTLTGNTLTLPEVLERLPENERKTFLDEASKTIDLMTDILVEGTTEYVTLVATKPHLIKDINLLLSSGESGYPVHAGIICNMRTKFGSDEKRFDAAVIQSALTGDFRILMDTFGEQRFKDFLDSSANILDRHIQRSHADYSKPRTSLSGD